MKSTRKYRCGRGICREIYHLPKPPDQYVTTKTCRCGGTLHDYTNERKRNKAAKCQCDGYTFPHSQGRSVWCKHHPTGPTSEDFEDRYGR